ncbi:glycosyltransferase family 2 protein [Bifidobacterium felsineum]|uniref:Glycosyltransferase 2-like domain-containing protein n=1 Tax=Bifidobacterium felsineum TaxID=2045440 RepID=A0A2M9HHS9_9BIFI|nr:glycosyltransferase family 2 protein [Bifidobacterium felsineum]PJM76388.1 hypothetical protein CSQ86_09600 [Bifidobacterium felsineum]
MHSTIILGTYNGEKYLPEFLTSLENQTNQDFDILVSDDLSKDNTLNILKSSIFFRTSRMKIISNNSNHGAAGNFINAINYSPESEYYFFADQDDYWHKDKISILSLLLSNKDNNIPQLVFSDLEVVDKELNNISKSYFSYTKFNPSNKNLSFPRLLIENRVPGCAMGFNKKLFMLMRGNINPQKIVMHDYIALQIAAFFGEIHHLNQSLIKYRQHETNTIGAPQYSLSYFVKRIKRFYLKYGVHIYKHRHNQMILKENQASVLIKLPNASTRREYEVVKQFASLELENKLRRILFLIKEKVYYDKTIETIQGFLTI